MKVRKMSHRESNTKRSGSPWTEKEKERVWINTRACTRGTSVNCLVEDDDIIEDKCGAEIQYSEHGKKTDKGWHIDHIHPVSEGGRDDWDNLQALQWRNNLSKGDKEWSDFECVEPYESSIF